MPKIKLLAAMALAAVVGATALVTSGDASARTAQCWRCVGGYCCY